MTELLALGLCMFVFPTTLEFTAGTAEGSHREVNGLQDRGQSCWEKSCREKQKKENRSELLEQFRVFAKESANNVEDWKQK